VFLIFLRNEFIEEKFLEKIKMAIFPTVEEIKECYKKHGADDTGWVTFQVGDSFNSEHPFLSRDIGSDVLPMIQNTEKPFWLVKDKNFGYNSLWCEWCYVIDLDERTFEIFKGFNEEMLNENERFYSEQSNDNYYGVKLLKKYSLSNLPTSDDFLKDLESLREKE